MNAKNIILTILVATFAPSWGFATGVAITNIEPTPLFPRQPEGQPLRQLVRLHLENPGKPAATVARITIGSQPPETQDLGTVARGQTVATVQAA